MFETVADIIPEIVEAVAGPLTNTQSAGLELLTKGTMAGFEGAWSGWAAMQQSVNQERQFQDLRGKLDHDELLKEGIITQQSKEQESTVHRDKVTQNKGNDRELG